MASGVSVNSGCIGEYQKLKSRHYKYIIFMLNEDNTEIVVDNPPGKSAEGDYEEFLDRLPKAECRWAVYDLEFEKEGAGRRNKICFYSWSPDEAKIKNKMLYASSRDALRRSLDGIAVEIQGTEPDEVAHDTVLDKAKRGN